MSASISSVEVNPINHVESKLKVIVVTNIIYIHFTKT